MLPKILAIKHRDDDDYSGYIVELSNGDNLSILISNFQNCCESFGYVTTNDSISEFVGAHLISYSIVDTDMAVKTNQVMGTEIYNMQGTDSDAGGVVFLNVETDRGVLQLCVYNNHNGYYGHLAEVRYGKEPPEEFHI